VSDVVDLDERCGHHVGHSYFLRCDGDAEPQAGTYRLASRTIRLVGRQEFVEGFGNAV
jgi:hypothetical protein